jgi:hypothetical protein
MSHAARFLRSLPVLACALIPPLASGCKFGAESESGGGGSFCESASVNSAGFSGGDGSASSPYLICTPDQLELIASTSLSASYALMADLDMGDTAHVPIGSISAGFSGTLEGNGHTLVDLGVSQASQNNAGLFGGFDGTVRNLKVIGAIVGARNVGGIAGYTAGGVISNVSFSGIVTGTGIVGGLVGLSDSGISISRSSSTGSVTATGGAPEGVGGLVGACGSSTSQSDQIVDSYSTASLTGPGRGGLIGVISNGGSGIPFIISRSYFAGTGGGDAGIQDYGDSDPDPTIGVSATAVFFDSSLNAATQSIAGVTGLATSAMKQAATYSAWDPTVWRLRDGSYPVLQWQ